MNKWLFDTTYILPWFGIEVKIPELKLALTEILQSQTELISVTSCSLIEGKWKSIRSYQKTDNSEYLERANTALHAFGVGSYFEVIDPWVNPNITTSADELLIKGHKDYMDCLIASTAKILNLKLVSEDKELIEFISHLSNWTELKIIDWKQFTLDINLD